MTLEEALEASGAEPVNDIFLINPETRTITVPETEKIFGVSHDGNTERKHFRCPKVVGDNIDLSTMHLYINYQNANGDKYPYLVEDVQTDGGYITFSWLIGPDVVAYKGQVKFIVCAKKGDGVHPNETWYRTFYCPVIDQALQNQGIGSITASEAPEVVAVTGVKLDQTTLALDAGDSAQLTATVQPTNATNKSVTWSANNSNVSVSGGKVTAKTAGASVITVTTADGGYTAQCNVTVNESTATDHTELTSLSLDGNCYFDTEILPDQDTNTKAKWNLQSGTTYIAGARDDNYKIGYSCTDNIYVVRGTVSSAAKNAPFWANDWIIEQTNASCKVGDTIVATDAIDSFKLSSPYYLGNMSKNSTPAGTGVVGKIYYAQIYSGDTLVADMIPVKKSDGTLCLYDKVRKKYIYNAGTGTLKEG